MTLFKIKNIVILFYKKRVRMINQFKYSYISFENDTPWYEEPVVDLFLSYNSHNMEYNFNSIHRFISLFGRLGFIC